MLEGLRKFILGESAIIAIVIVAILGHASPEVCYSIAGIGTGVSIANAIKSKNGKG